MLKACWDCIAGPQVENEAVPTTQLNGRTQRAPPWPLLSQLSNEIMFILPKRLNVGDELTVTGNMLNDPKLLTVSFLTGNMTPDYQNIACQLEATFPANHINPNRLTLKVIENGQDETVPGDYNTYLATELFTDLNFKFGFSLRVNGNSYNGYTLQIFIGESYFEEVKLKHNIDDIRFLSLNGDIANVDELNFKFAKKGEL